MKGGKIPGLIGRLEGPLKIIHSTDDILQKIGVGILDSLFLLPEHALSEILEIRLFPEELILQLSCFHFQFRNLRFQFRCLILFFSSFLFFFRSQGLPEAPFPGAMHPLPAPCCRPEVSLLST
eukprot:Anaeramoba_ignava/a5673_3.p1 GENE.a5673_3~~a5673_3.p1  ORF type:complete len:123 (+),score=5.06 a5673_3:117-485(+)